jgi:hypothetical protein
MSVHRAEAIPADLLVTDRRVAGRAYRRCSWQVSTDSSWWGAWMGVSGDDMGSLKRNCGGRPQLRPSGITPTAMRQIASESDVIIEDTSLALTRRRHHAGRRSRATTAKLAGCVRSGAASD